eukprot:scaffold334_cov241-Pinguiococcus_pyrenoidosus.AAC.52
MTQTRGLLVFARGGPSATRMKALLDPSGAPATPTTRSRAVLSRPSSEPSASSSWNLTRWYASILASMVRREEAVSVSDARPVPSPTTFHSDNSEFPPRPISSADPSSLPVRISFRESMGSGAPSKGCRFAHAFKVQPSMA